MEKFRMLHSPIIAATSGQTFRWRGITNPEYVEILGGFPNIRIKPESSDKSIAEAAKANMEFKNALIVRCVDFPRIVETEADAGDDGLPLSALYPQDVIWLADRIVEGSTYSKADADTARGVL